jgi:hypothetical protein
MPESKSTPTPKSTEKATEKATDEVQEAVDSETEQGFRGVEVDQTPNENYTVQGVTAGKPVPEAEADPTEARRKASQG